MLQKTQGIVLRSVKYGETSLVCTIFTEVYGVQSYMVQGVRTGKAGKGRAGLLQPTSLIDMIVYHKPNANLQRIKEFHPAYIYNTVPEQIVKNSIALFSIELLLRLLPEHAPMSELFHMVVSYLQLLDKKDAHDAANYPIYFAAKCCEELGYTITGNYSAETPYLNLQEGGFTHNEPMLRPFVPDEDARMLDRILTAGSIEGVAAIEMNAAMRFRLLDWFIEFMHNHTQHMGEVKSLSVLRAVLH